MLHSSSCLLVVRRSLHVSHHWLLGVLECSLKAKKRERASEGGNAQRNGITLTTVHAVCVCGGVGAVHLIQPAQSMVGCAMVCAIHCHHITHPRLNHRFHTITPVRSHRLCVQQMYQTQTRLQLALAPPLLTCPVRPQRGPSVRGQH